MKPLFLNETTIADTIQLNYILSIQFKEISIDGEIDLWFTDNTKQRFES